MLTPTHSLLRQLKWMPLQNHFIFRKLILTFKDLRHMTLEYLFVLMTDMDSYATALDVVSHVLDDFYDDVLKEKQKYRGMLETQKSRNKTSSGDIGLNISTLASPKVGQDQVSGGVSVLCWHAAPVANVLWKPLAIR